MVIKLIQILDMERRPQQPLRHISRSQNQETLEFNPMVSNPMMSDEFLSEKEPVLPQMTPVIKNLTFDFDLNMTSSLGWGEMGVKSDLNWTKVYFMLAIMLSITAGVICICLLVEPINSYIRNGGGLWIMWTGWGVFIFLYFFLVCPCCSVRRKYPLNLVMLGLISIAMGWSLGATCCYYEFDEIVQAGLGTVGIVVGITLLTYLNFFDITKIWQIIMLIPLAMLFTWPWFWIFGYNNALYTFYCSLGVAAAALFLAFDTKMIMGGGRIELSPDEWVVAVVELYYDICLIFQYMLALMGRD